MSLAENPRAPANTGSCLCTLAANRTLARLDSEFCPVTKLASYTAPSPRWVSPVYSDASLPSKSLRVMMLTTPPIASEP